MPRTDRLMLLDTASMYFRAFFGVPEILADDGTPVNAVLPEGLPLPGEEARVRFAPGHVGVYVDDWRAKPRAAASERVA